MKGEYDIGSINIIQGKMKAIMYNKYGAPENLKLTEVDKPIPKDNEVLVKVHASSINSAYQRSLRANPFFVRFMGQGLFRPKYKILGVDHIIDYKKETFVDKGICYDLIFDVVANLSVDGYKQLLNPKGTCVVVGFSAISHMIKLTLQGSKASRNSNIKIGHRGSSNPSNKELDFLR